MSRLTKRQAERIMRENDGNLPLEYSDITKLPKALTVEGYLDLLGTPIQELPIGLKVKEYLRLGCTQVTSLPNDLCVGEELDLTDTQIKEVTSSAISVRILNCSNTPLEKLPDNFTVETLSARGSNLKELPNKLNIIFDLDISDTQISIIPKDISIGRDFSANRTPLKELPNIDFCGDVCLAETQIKELPEKLTIINGNLNLEGTPINTLKNIISVNGSLDLSGTQITSLPDNLTVQGCLIINETPIKQLPNQLNVGELVISEEQLNSITFPDDMICGGYSADTNAGKISGRVFRARHIYIAYRKDEYYGDSLMSLEDYAECMYKSKQTYPFY